MHKFIRINILKFKINICSYFMSGVFGFLIKIKLLFFLRVQILMPETLRNALKNNFISFKCYLLKHKCL